MIASKTGLVAGLLFAGAAHAQGFMPWTDIMMMPDANGDGMLPVEEVKAVQGMNHLIGLLPFMVDHFADCDKNKDGMVSMFELKVCAKGMGMTDEKHPRCSTRDWDLRPASGSSGSWPLPVPCERERAVHPHGVPAGRR